MTVFVPYVVVVAVPLTLAKPLDPVIVALPFVTEVVVLGSVRGIAPVMVPVC